MRNALLKEIKKHRKGISAPHLAKALRADLRLVRKELAALAARSLITYRDGRASMPSAKEFFKGTLEIKAKGYGFVAVEGIAEDIFIPEYGLGNALSGDEVLVRLKAGHRRRLMGVIVKVVRRAHAELAGRIDANYQFTAFIPGKVRFKIANITAFAPDDLVRVKIERYKEGTARGTIIQKTGNLSAPGGELAAIALAHGFYENRGRLDPAIKQPNTRPLYQGNIYTIDSIEAKDLDDAVAIEKLADGWRLSVYIADVGYYVRPGTALDDDAYEKGVSVYLGPTVVPLFPFKLANDVCSLKAGSKRLVVACHMEIGPDGNVRRTKLEEAAIVVKERLTYRFVEDVINGKTASHPDLLEMNKLRLALFEKRKRRGAMLIQSKALEFTFDAAGRPIRAYEKPARLADSLIEEFMIVANESVAHVLERMKAPALFRVHDQPPFEKLYALAEILANFGINLPLASHVDRKALQKVSSKLADNPVLTTLFIRSLAKAEYQVQNIGHFGLASPSYVHFTAPIRRYPDLLIHRLLKKYVFKSEPGEIRSLAAAGEHLSRREREAASAEWEAEDLFTIRFLADKIGQRFTGFVTGFDLRKIYVKLECGVETHLELARPVKAEQGVLNLGDKKLYLGQKITVCLTRIDETQKKAYVKFAEE